MKNNNYYISFEVSQFSYRGGHIKFFRTRININIWGLCADIFVRQNGNFIELLSVFVCIQKYMGIGHSKYLCMRVYVRVHDRLRVRQCVYEYVRVR